MLWALSGGRIFAPIGGGHGQISIPEASVAPRAAAWRAAQELAQAIRTDAARAQSREPPRDAVGTDRGDKRRT